MKKRLLWDLDDVFFPTAEAIVNNYRRCWGVAVPLRLFYSCDPHVWGVDDPKVAIHRNYEFYETEEYAMLPPHPAARALLTLLAPYYDHHIGTGRPELVREITEKACDRNFPNLIESITFLDYAARSAAGLTTSKGDVAEQLNVAAHTDDHVPHALDVAARGIPAIVCGDYPWNREPALLPANVTRVPDLSLVGDLLLEKVAA